MANQALAGGSEPQRLAEIKTKVSYLAKENS
jgi:hypothetical protein